MNLYTQYDSATVIITLTIQIKPSTPRTFSKILFRKNLCTYIIHKDPLPNSERKKPTFPLNKGIVLINKIMIPPGMTRFKIGAPSFRPAISILYL